MNKCQYLDQLKQYLKGFPQDELEDILSDYEEHFDIGISKGKTEEEISMELGNPRDIAQNFKNNHTSNNYNHKKRAYILLGLVLISIGFAALSLRHNKDFKLGDRGWNTSNASKGHSVKIGTDGIEVKDGNDHVSIGPEGINVSDGKEKLSIGWKGIDIGKSNKSGKGSKGWNIFNSNKNLKKIEIDEERAIKIDGIEDIEIVSQFIDTRLTPIDAGEAKVKLVGSMETDLVPELKIEKSSGRVKIAIENNSKKGYTVGESDVTLEIFIPKNYSNNIKIEGSSADMDIKGIKIVNLNISSDSGDIYIKDIFGGSLNLASSSGDLDIKDAIGSMELKSSSGDIYLDNKENNKDIKVNSSSGDVFIVFGENSSYRINARSASGEFKSLLPINIDGDNYNDGEIKATMGSGKNSIEVNTSSGDIEFSKN